MSSASSSSSTQTLTLTLTLTLIPGLPNDIASLILSLIPFSHHARLKSTSKSWYAFLSSHQPSSLHRSIISPSGPHHPTLLCIFPQDPSLSHPYLFDPYSSAWAPLPLLPCSPHRYGLSNFVSVSLGPDLYVLGGSLFDARSFPIDRPSPSSTVFRLHLPSSSSWSRLRSMITPRGSFACAAAPSSNSILVAGGGSRHALFGAAGTRMRSAERYDIDRDEWFPEESLPRFRAGCVGFLAGEDEFWVMGGYGDYRMVSGVFPVDEHYRDGVVLDLKTGKWREIGDMWGEGGRGRLGPIAVVDGMAGKLPGIFMLDGNTIFRYDIASNRWQKESTLPRKAPRNSSCGFVALGGELHVMFAPPCFDMMDSRRLRPEKMILFIHVYNPNKKTWRYLMAKRPFHFPLDFKTAVMCTIQL